MHRRRFFTRLPFAGLPFFGLALPAGAVLSGCAGLAQPFDYRAGDAPQALALTELQAGAAPPRLAVVLGSGGPRGYAHIGVLRVLEEAGITPDMVVGSSVGSVIGAFWASGLSAAAIDALSRTGGPLTLFDISPFADRGFIHGQRLQDYVNTGLAGRRLEQLPRPLIVVATRRADKAPAFFQRGNTGVAVRASSAMPGAISPVGIGGVEYEDGDESLPVAVSAARAAGAQFVLAIDVSAHGGSAPADASPAQQQRLAARRGRIDPELALADFVIHPDLGFRTTPFPSFFEHARNTGERVAREQLPALLASLQRAGMRTQRQPM